MMHRSLLLAFVSSFAVASVALASTGRAAPKATLAQAVSQTNSASTLRYVLDITVTRAHSPTARLQVRGERGNQALFIHVKQLSAAVPGATQSAMIDGPFLYEGAPNGVAVLGHIKWLRVPLARLGAGSKAVSTVHNLSPAPLLRVLDEWSHGRTRSTTGSFRGAVAYDDPIVLTALSAFIGGAELRDVQFAAKIGDDGYVHTVVVTGKTADRSRTLRVTAHLYAFGRPVSLTPPAEGTFMDQKTLGLAE
ncbi:MAG: hypothetical protein ACRDLE_11770 [Gaiellaceae bacterium]